MSDQQTNCEVSEVIFRVLNRGRSVMLCGVSVAYTKRCDCVLDVFATAGDGECRSFKEYEFVFKSLRTGDLQHSTYITPSFIANLANHRCNLANLSLNLAIPEANLASESLFSQGKNTLCEVSEVISLPSHVRTRARTRAGETNFQYRSDRKITSHNLVTSQLRFRVGRRSIADVSITSVQRTTLAHVARFLTSRPTSRLSRWTRHSANYFAMVGVSP